jgi:hypothetical protein
MTEQHDAPEGVAKESFAYRLYGALNFIMAFYEPGQKHLDTNAWKNAEASARHLLAEGWPKQFDPAATPPAPSGLVDAAKIVKRVLDIIDQDAEACGVAGFKWPNDVNIDPILPSGNQPDICTLGELRIVYATLSGQQGGAVPAGDLALLRECEPFIHFNAGIAATTTKILQERLRARLAEQPAPAKLDDGYARKIDLGLGWYIARFVDREWRLYDDRNFRVARFESEADALVFAKNFAKQPVPAGAGAFVLGDRVEKTEGSSWRGRIVGTYSTSLTPRGYAVESEREPGSVQIYPEAALRPAPAGTGDADRVNDIASS